MMLRTRQACATVAAVAILSATALPGQTAILSFQWTGTGSSVHEYYGVSVAPVHDVDGDGYEDFAVGDPQQSDGTSNYPPGGVYVRSGLDGAIIYNLQIGSVTTYYRRFGRSVAGLGDVNGDGRADFAVGANFWSPSGTTTYPGRVWLYSGATGTALWTFEGTVSGYVQGLGRYMDDVGDLNNDGVHDLFVGGTSYTVPEHCLAHVLSGVDGSVIHTFLGGRTGAVVGDVNNDGHLDMAVMRETGTGTYTPIEVSVHSGASGATLFTIAGLVVDDIPSTTNFVPKNIGPAGDVNGDGRDDILISHVGPISPIQTQVRSGLNGAVLFTINALGWGCASAGDVNGDGRDDFLLLDGYSLRLCSGMNGTVLQTVSLTTPSVPNDGGQAIATSACSRRVFATIQGRSPTSGGGHKVLAWTGGQMNSHLAGLAINAVGTDHCAGPFSVGLTPGGSLTLTWSGPPNAPLVLVSAPLNPHHAFYPGVGMADVGTPPYYGDVIPIFNGLLPTFPHLLFRTDANGFAEQTFPVPVLPPGPLLSLQGIVVQGAPSSAGTVLTAAHTLSMN